jgi:hypothetical protein
MAAVIVFPGNRRALRGPRANPARPRSVAQGIPESLMRRLLTLSGEQLAIVEVLVAGVQAGVR